MSIEISGHLQCDTSPSSLLELRAKRVSSFNALRGGFSLEEQRGGWRVGGVEWRLPPQKCQARAQGLRALGTSKLCSSLAVLFFLGGCAGSLWLGALHYGLSSYSVWV